MPLSSKMIGQIVSSNNSAGANMLGTIYWPEKDKRIGPLPAKMTRAVAKANRERYVKNKGLLALPPLPSEIED